MWFEVGPRRAASVMVCTSVPWVFSLFLMSSVESKRLRTRWLVAGGVLILLLLHEGFLVIVMSG